MRTPNFDMKMETTTSQSLFFAYYIFTRPPQNATTMTPRLLLFLSLLIQLLLLKLGVSAQELPLYTTPEAFNFSISHRQNVCDRQQAFHNRDVELRYALEGLELRAWMPLSNAGWSDLDPVTGAISDDPSPGLNVEILDEIAKRGRFTWRNSFGVAYIDNVADLGKNFEDVLVWVVDTYDIAAGGFSKTLSRVNKGGSFPHGFIDSSTIMIGKLTEEKKLNMWAFLAPFKWQVWLLILVTYIVSGMLYQWMEYVNENSDRQKLGDKPTETIYFSALTFVGDNKFQPSTDYARLFIAALAFFSLLVGSAYTANLASFLVIRNTPTIQIQTIQEAVQADYVFCTLIGTPQDDMMAKSYPKARVVRIDATVDGEGGIYLGVIRGECDIALGWINSWERYKGNSTTNQDCQLDWVGRVVKFRQGGFVTQSDSGTLCTSLIRDVFNLYMLEMEEQGFTSGVVKKYYDASADQQCDRLPSEKESSNNADDEFSQQLGLLDMGGLFICFYVLAVILALVALITRLRAKWKHFKNESVDNSSPSTQEGPNITPEASPESDDASSISNFDSDQQKLEAQSSVVVDDEDALLAHLDTLQCDLKEAISELRQRNKPQREPSVYIPVQYG